MTNIPDWIMAVCAVFSVVVSLISLARANGASKSVEGLTAQVNTLNAELTKVSSSMKDSRVKQTNKSGDGNQFIGGSHGG